jgi:hypothetical protein
MLKKSDILDVMDVIFESEKNEKQNNWVEKLGNSTSDLILMHSVKWFNCLHIQKQNLMRKAEKLFILVTKYEK